MKKIEFNVKSMHCRSCETLVKDDLGEVPGVRKVEADYRKGLVRLEAEDSVNLDMLKAKIRELGYEVV